MNIRERTEEIERMTLSPFAMLAENTRGRKYPREKCPIRPDYQCDPNPETISSTLTDIVLDIPGDVGAQLPEM